MRQREIEYVPIDQLMGALSNPKRHRVDLVRRSISRFGYVAPAIIDERTNRLVVGHGRTEALIALRDQGDTPPEGVRLADDGTWLVPVLRGWSSRSDEEAAAYLVTDNRHTELGGWNHEDLAKLLDDIGDPDLVELTGWNLDELTELLDDTEEMSDEDDADSESVDLVWGVAVTCKNEKEQTDLIERLTDDGYQVRALM